RAGDGATKSSCSSHPLPDCLDLVVYPARSPETFVPKLADRGQTPPRRPLVVDITVGERRTPHTIGMRRCEDFRYTAAPIDQVDLVDLDSPRNVACGGDPKESTGSTIIFSDLASGRRPTSGKSTGVSKRRGRKAVSLLECGTEMAVARETEVERQARQIGT